MQLTLNGEVIEIPAPLSVAHALTMWGYTETAAIALAIDQVFIPRHHYAQTFLTAGMTVDIVVPMEGG